MDKFLLELSEQLKQKKIELELTDEARTWLMTKGFDPIYGARPLARVINDQLKRVLSEEILFGKLKDGGAVLVELKAGKLQFQYGQTKSKHSRLAKAIEG
jgi:ATP-dependent Clp protease ATP-binding subunit ClpA